MSADATRRGILFFAAAIFLFATMDVVAKWLMERHDPLMVVWARYNSQLLWTLVIFLPNLRTLMRTRHPWLQLLRSAFLFCATICFFLSLRHLQLAEAVAIFEVAPLLITALSVVVLKEVVGPRRWFGVLIGLCGALIIIRPGTDVFQPAAFLPILAATCFAAYTISTRFLGQDEAPATSFIYTTVIGAIAAFAFLPWVWTRPEGIDLPVMLTFGMIGGLGHFLLILAFTATQASILAPLSYLGLVFSAVYGVLIFSEVPDAWTWIGAAVVISAGVYVWYRENYGASATDG